ncbi:MAG: glycosyltransferase [Clostridia bacterium]|nr:glycosyltransferase [Clostridia bacterium]
MKVSVYCLAYNHAKYIRKALDGFVMQKTNFAYEVFVHDDASTDGTADIIREYEAKYPHIIKGIYQTENQHSQKIPIVTTHILPNMSGEYIACCEGDDYWIDENKLQMQYDIMQTHPEVVFCAHKVQCVNEDMSMNSRVIPGDGCGLHENKLLSKEELSDLLFIKGAYAFHTSSYFISKKVFVSEERQQLRTKMNGDQTIMYATLLYGNTYFINQIMSYRRLLTEGNWHQRYAQFSEKKQSQHHLNFCDGTLLFDEVSNGVYHDKIMYNAYLRLMSLSLQFNNDIVKQYFADFKKKYKFNWFYSLKLSGAYLMYYLCPGLLRKKLKL